VRDKEREEDNDQRGDARLATAPSNQTPKLAYAVRWWAATAGDLGEALTLAIGDEAEREGALERHKARISETPFS
jgi:hypothetical protein